MDYYKFIDLFSGLGGFQNNQCVFACDIDEKCREVYKSNFNLTPFSDITKLDISSIP